MFIEGYLDRQQTLTAVVNQSGQLSPSIQNNDTDVRDLLYAVALAAEQQTLAGSDEFNYRMIGNIEGSITPPPILYYRGLSVDLGAISLEEAYARWISETNPVAIGLAQ